MPRCEVISLFDNPNEPAFDSTSSTAKRVPTTGVFSFKMLSSGVPFDAYRRSFPSRHEMIFSEDSRD